MQRFMRNVLAGAVLATALGLFGCSDDAEHKAVKQARQSCRKALDVYRASGDIDAAREQLRKALTVGGKTGTARDTAVFIGANLAFAEAESAFAGQAGVAAGRESAFGVTDEISLALGRIRQLKLRQERLNAARTARQAQVNELADILDKSRALMASLQSQLQDLEAQKQSLQPQVAEAQEQAAKLQLYADELFRQGELATGKEKVAVQRQAYDLILGRGTDQPSRPALLAEAQLGLDQITVIDSQLDLIKPRIDPLEENIGTVKKRLGDIETSLNKAELAGETGQIDVQLSRQRQNVLELIRKLKGAEKACSDKVAGIVDLLTQAGAEYKRVRFSKAAKLASADCSYRTGFIRAENMKFQEGLNVRLIILAEFAEKLAADALTEFAEQCRQKADDFGSGAMEDYTQAVEKYEKLSRSLRRSRDEFAGSVTKNYMLALIEQARLARLLGQDDIAEAALAGAEELVEQAVGCDPAFGDSPTAGLLLELAPEIVIPAAEELPRETLAAAEPSEGPEATEERALFADANSLD